MDKPNVIKFENGSLIVITETKEIPIRGVSSEVIEFFDSGEVKSISCSFGKGIHNKEDRT